MPLLTAENVPRTPAPNSKPHRMDGRSAPYHASPVYLAAPGFLKDAVGPPTHRVHPPTPGILRECSGLLRLSSGPAAHKLASKRAFCVSLLPSPRYRDGISENFGGMPSPAGSSSPSSARLLLVCGNWYHSALHDSCFTLSKRPRRTPAPPPAQNPTASRSSTKPTCKGSLLDPCLGITPIVSAFACRQAHPVGTAPTRSRGNER